MKELDALRQKLRAAETLAGFRALRLSLGSAPAPRFIWDQLGLKYTDALLRRIISLGDTASAAVETSEWLPSSMFCRGYLETAALAYTFSTQFENTLADKKATLIQKYVFATRVFEADKKGFHINDCLREITKCDPDYMQRYDLLCEAVHPNWFGVMVLAQEPDEERELAAFIYECLASGQTTLHSMQRAVSYDRWARL